MSQGSIWHVDLDTEADTIRLGTELAMGLRVGDYLALKGDLGTGKTVLARAIIRALSGNAQEDVPSPTFTLVQPYETSRIPVWHFDLYRLKNSEEILELGFEEAEERGVSLIEWPELMADLLPTDYLEIALEDARGKKNARLIAHGKWTARLERIKNLNSFLSESGWQNAERSWLQGDASSRTYEKLRLDQKTSVLMNAPLQPDGPPIRAGKAYSQIAHLAQNMTPFCAIADYLRKIGLGAPQIRAQNLDEGFLLLEDLGNDVFSSRVLDGKDMDAPYEMAIEALRIMHEQPAPHFLPTGKGADYKVPEYDWQAFGIELELLIEWYWPFIKQEPASDDLRESYMASWKACLSTLSNKKTLVLRDFHSPNLLWLAERKGVARAGLIDFQDALIGPPAYDLVSLLQDARVDVPESLEASLRLDYMKNTSLDALAREAFMADYALMGAQRAAKILGIFVRLARRDHKTDYLKHIPRVHGYLWRNLEHSALIPVKAWFEQNLPH